MIAYIRLVLKITSYWAPIIGSFVGAFYFLVCSKFGVSTTKAVYRGNTFRFRSCDMPAIDETLIRGEYQFITPVFMSVDEPLVLDVGMNIGDFSIFAMAVNPNCLIVGVEADATTAALAVSNQPSQANCLWTVHHRAAWRNNDQIYLETGPVSVSNRVSENGRIPVQGIDLATLWSLLPREEVDVMKIDVEGAEEEFLFSQPELLDKVKHLIIEIHPLACSEARIRSLLKQHFSCVEDISGRISSKSLLYCYRA